MSCNCNGAKKKDYEYVRKLAKIYSEIEKADVQIYHFTQSGIGKLYDFEIKNETRPQVVEVIEFREPESEIILSDTELNGLVFAEPKKHKSKRRAVDESVVSDFGEVLS